MSPRLPTNSPVKTYKKPCIDFNELGSPPPLQDTETRSVIIRSAAEPTHNEVEQTNFRVSSYSSREIGRKRSTEARCNNLVSKTVQTSA